MGFKVGCLIGFFYPPEKTCQYKEVTAVSKNSFHSRTYNYAANNFFMVCYYTTT